MSTATAGRGREHKVRDHMADHGWTPIMRSAASKGAADLAMAHPEHGLALVQVGARSKTLSPADRARFLNAAELCSALPVLAIAANRTPIRYWLVTAGTASTWQEWKP